MEGHEIIMTTHARRLFWVTLHSPFPSLLPSFLPAITFTTTTTTTTTNAAAATATTVVISTRLTRR
ncbi:hypothetical protein E2C01_030860 [Portunus trituberculatus]|uniref:Uncharacterized protein n=1 Tax=Portunus trituberculatus TaxID=210409 RepID=A0A5B7EVC1_PORTR|nr:hypothetical protein [Portunus trituberculatus]